MAVRGCTVPQSSYLRRERDYRTRVKLLEEELDKVRGGWGYGDASAASAVQLLRCLWHARVAGSGRRIADKLSPPPPALLCS